MTVIVVKNGLSQSFEKICGLLCCLRARCRRKSVELLVSTLLVEGLEALHQGKLRGARAEGLELTVLYTAGVERDCPGGRQWRRTAWKEEAAGVVEEALGRVDWAERREALGQRCPLEGGGRQEGDHGVICMGVGRPVAPERKDDVWPIAADAFDQKGSGLGKVDELHLSVVVIEHLGMRDAENLAGSGKLPATHEPQLGRRGCCAAVGGSLAIGEANNRGFDACFGSEHKRSAESEALIIGVGCYA